MPSKEAVKELENIIKSKEQELFELQQKLELIKKEIPEESYTPFISKELLLEWMNYLNESVQVCDRGGNLIFVNSSTSQLTGYPLEELLTMNVQDLELDFKGIHNWNKKLEQLKTKESIVAETQYLRKNGSSFPVEIKIKYAVIKGIEYVIIISHDITDKKAKETQLIRNKLILKEILNNTSDAIFFVDTTTNIVVDCNDRSLELFEYESKSSLVGQNSNILFGSSIPDIEYEKIKKQMRDIGQYNAELVCKTSKERIFWGSICTTIIKLHNEASYYLLRIKDIDLKKASEESLQKSEKRYRDLIYYNQALICTHTLDGIITSVNPATCKLLHFQEHEMIGENLSKLFDPKNIPSYQSYIYRINNEGVDSGVMEVLTKDGNKMYWLYNNYKVTEGEQSYVVGTAQDISERILVQKELKKAKNIALQSLKARELFLANVSHEIRTPLHGILGISSLLNKTNLTKEQQHLVEIIRRSADNLVVIINDILDVAKMEAGRLQLESIAFNFKDCINNTIEPWKYKAQAKGLKLELIMPSKVFFIKGDPYRLSQIINNLVSNAIKFTDKGSVKVSVEIFAHFQEEIILDIRVADTGIGIATEKLEEIFNEFVQADNSHTRVFGGTGLGLSICKKLVELQKGKIYVESIPETGSTFGFIMPFVQGQASNHTINNHIDLNFISNLKILIVEDNPINQLIAQNILLHNKAIVDTATSGQEALDLVQENNYDVILMDIQMPDMDGQKITALIRSMTDPQKANIPIIAITANAMKGDNEKYIKAGMNNYLSKPYSSDELFHKIAFTLDYPMVLESPKEIIN